MTFLMFFQEGIIFPISKLIELLQDTSIATYFFGNRRITLWSVLFVFFLGSLVIKFILRPFPLVYKVHPIDLAKRRESSSNSESNSDG